MIAATVQFKRGFDHICKIFYELIKEHQRKSSFIVRKFRVLDKADKVSKNKNE